MADFKKKNENDNIGIWSELVSQTIFGKDASKNDGRRLAIGLFNDGIYVQIARQDPDDNKSKAFKNRTNFVTTKTFAEIGLANIARAILKRLKKMEAGETLAWNPITLYSSTNVMTALTKVDFDASTFIPKGESKGRPLISVTINKRKDKDDKDVSDLDVWAFFSSLEMNMLSCVDKSSTSRAVHMTKFLEAKLGSDDSSEKSSSKGTSSKKSYDEDDDEDSLPF